MPCFLGGPARGPSPGPQVLGSAGESSVGSAHNGRRSAATNENRAASCPPSRPPTLPFDTDARARRGARADLRCACTAVVGECRERDKGIEPLGAHVVGGRATLPPTRVRLRGSEHHEEAKEERKPRVRLGPHSLQRCRCLSKAVLMACISVNRIWPRNSALRIGVRRSATVNTRVADAFDFIGPSEPADGSPCFPRGVRGCSPSNFPFPLFFPLPPSSPLRRPEPVVPE